MILALDSSTAIAGAALYNENGVAAEFSWLSHRDQTVQMMPLIQKMFDLQQSSPDKLTGVAVAIGPGSFNGLRVAVSEAKGVALALRLPIFGFSGLDVLAAANAYLSGMLCAIAEAGRGRVYAAFYKVKGGKWKREGEYLNLSIAELIDQITQPVFVVGELKNEQRAELGEKLAKTALLLPPSASLRRPAVLGEMAWQRLQAGDQGDNLANLQPIYLHQPVQA